MKCIYYLSPTLDSTSRINDDLHQAGINGWFIHVLSKDEAGLRKRKIHSSNYIEQLDLVRFGIIGAVTGFLAALLALFILKYLQPFGSELPGLAYFGVAVGLTLFGAWEGGLIGIASENKKISVFHNDIESGKYLIIIYTKDKDEAAVKKVMIVNHPEAELVAEDEYFYNPLSDLKRV